MTGGAKQAGWAAWLVVLVIPPAVAGGLGQGFVSHHAGWAVGIGVVYEAIVAIIGFFAVIARDVSSRWQNRLADRFDLFLQRKVAHFERQYREFVLSSLRFIDHKGLATVGPFTPELDEVFVDVALVPSPPQQIGPGLLSRLAGEQAERQILSDFLGQEQPAVLAVVGSPGSGKTTLLRHAARQSCLYWRSYRGRRRHRRNIPILLYLRDHVAAITADPATSVATLLRATLGAVGADEPPHWFEEQLRAGQCLVMLDGLDEVAVQEDRAKVSAWAESQIRQFPGNDFVVSSRPQGYQTAPVEGASILRVCGFTASQTAGFIGGWYQAVERHSTGTSGPEAQARAAEGASDLLQRLEQAPALYDLTVNPLLLTMIANVHRYRGALPGSRADLYTEICQVMLRRRQDAKQLTQRMSGNKKETVLRGLAYTMMRQYVSDLDRADVFTQIRPTLQRMSGEITPEILLAEVSSDGLFIERETGQYAFAHKTFQEYLAAAYIREENLVGVLADAVSEDWWVETTLLFAATSPADRIVQACLDANTGHALALALDCTDQDSDVALELRRRVNDLVISAAQPSADRERRYLFAGILLSRHMRQYRPATGSTQVCTEPVPAEMYRLFLADTQTPQPDAPLTESGIAIGMRGNDADAFIRWVTVLSGGQHSYRLPSVRELTGLAAQKRIPDLPSGYTPWVWARASSGSSVAPPVLWLPPGSPAPYEVNARLLAIAVKTDLARSAFMLSELLLRSRLLACTLHGINLVYDRVGALSPDLDLDLVLALDRANARDLDKVLEQAHALAKSVALVRRGEYAPAFSRDRRALDRILNHDARDLARNLDLARVRELNRSLTHGRAFERVYATEANLDRGLASDLGLDLDRVLTSNVGPKLDLDLTPGIDLVIRERLLVNSNNYSTQSRFGKACRFVLGQAFSRAIVETLRSDSHPRGPISLFTATFIDAVGIGGSDSLTADPATLNVTLQKAVKKLAQAPGEAQLETPGSVAVPVVAERLKRDAGSIFTRAEPPTPEKATAIRMAALCLAAEADDIERADIGDMFRQVAAGITLLERRAAGDRLAAEVIMLATECSAARAHPQETQAVASTALAVRRGRRP